MNRSFPHALWWAASTLLASGAALPASEGASATDSSRSASVAGSVHDGVEYVGRRLTLLDPMAERDFASSMSDRRRWHSAIVGPRVRVTDFQDTGFKKQRAVLQPGQRVSNLDQEEFGWPKDAASVRITCASLR